MVTHSSGTGRPHSVLFYIAQETRDENVKAALWLQHLVEHRYTFVRWIPFILIIFQSQNLDRRMVRHKKYNSGMFTVVIKKSIGQTCIICVSM